MEGACLLIRSDRQKYCLSEAFKGMHACNVDYSVAINQIFPGKIDLRSI
jgi:hypothetical protein